MSFAFSFCPECSSDITEYLTLPIYSFPAHILLSLGHSWALFLNSQISSVTFMSVITLATVLNHVLIYFLSLLSNTSFHKIAYYIHTAASGSLIHSTYVLITKRQWTNAHVRREDSRLRARHFPFIFLRNMTIILLLLSIYNLI